MASNNDDDTSELTNARNCCAPKKNVDKHGLVDGAKAMMASPCIGKMEMVFLLPLATPELWNESQKYIKLFRTEDATTAPIA